MLCKKCGSELGESPDTCSECKAERLLRAGRGRAMRTAVLPLVVLVVLSLFGAIGYLYFLQQEQNPVIPQAEPIISKKPATNTNSKQKHIEGNKAEQIIVVRQVSGQLSDRGERVEIATASASFVDSQRLLVLTVFRENEPSGVSLVAELVLSLSTGDSCNDLKSAEFRQFAGGQISSRSNVIKAKAKTAEFELSQIQCSLIKLTDGRLKLNLSISSKMSSGGSFDFRYKGLVEIRKNVEFPVFSAEDMYQLALWDSRSGSVEIGFFTSKPSKTDISQYLKQQMILRGSGLRPKFGVRIKTLDELTELEPKGIKSYQVVLPRTKDSASGDWAEFYRRRLSPFDKEFIIKRGTLAHNSLLTLRLQDVESRPEKDLHATYAWNILTSAPIIDVRRDSVAGILEKLERLSTSEPQSTGGVLQTNSSQINVVDSLVLHYKKSNRYTIALYSEKLSAKDRNDVVARKSVWNAQKAQRPVAVVSLERSEQNAVTSLDVTFLRSFLGDYYFEGDRDRVTFIYTGKDVDSSNMLYFADSKKLKMRFRDQRRSENSIDSFFWDFEVSQKAVVIE